MNAWVRAVAEGTMLGAFLTWYWVAVYACLFGLMVCAFAVWEGAAAAGEAIWELGAAMWRMWPPA